MNDPTSPPESSFADLGIGAPLLQALAELGYEEPTPIQAAAIPPVLAGRDLVGQAATGTGKTAAFALPLLDRLGAGAGRQLPAALILVPTRELAIQVAEAVTRYGAKLGCRVVAVYGGAPIGPQLQALKRGVDLVVATPGRALDHLARKSLRLHELEAVVLDEADEMLDLGFAEDIEQILAASPSGRQVVLFSATMPARVDKIAKRYQHDPVQIRLSTERISSDEVGRVQQRVYFVARQHKPAALARLLDVEQPTASVVFCRTRAEVEEVTEALNRRGRRAEALHGGMDQQQRDRVMGRLRAQSTDLLIATDVAARGLDIDHLTHVVNYDVPSAPDAYVHRIGRVGRAGRKGVAITLAEPREQRLLQTIERVTKHKLVVTNLPSVAELRATRRRALRELMEEAPPAGGGDELRGLLEKLSGEFEANEVALRALRLAYEGRWPRTAEEEIPEVAPRPAGAAAGRAAPGRATLRPGAARPEHPKAGHPVARERATTGRPARARVASRAPGTTRLFISAGSEAGIRPKDLVGAIASEAGLAGKEIGAIEIAERFSLVEVPEAAAERIIRALSATTIRGAKAKVRRER